MNRLLNKNTTVGVVDFCPRLKNIDEHFSDVCECFSSYNKFKKEIEDYARDPDFKNKLKQLQNNYRDNNNTKLEFNVSKKFNIDEVFGDYPKTAYELLYKLGRTERCQQQSGNWFKRLILVSVVQELFQSIGGGKPTGFQIPQTSKMLKCFFLSQQNVSRAIRFSKKVGLIKVVEDCPQHFVKENNIVVQGKGRCKSYYWNKNVAKIIRQLVKEYGINDILEKKLLEFNKNHKNAEELTVVKTIQDIETYGIDYVIKNYRVGLSSSLMIPHCSDSEFKAIIYSKIPQIHDYQVKMDEANEFLDLDNRYFFNINIKRSKLGFITRSSARAYTRITNLPNMEKAIKNGKYDEHVEYIQKYVKKNFDKLGIENIYSYDVNGCVYRLKDIRNKKEWYKGDIYEKVFGHTLSGDERDLCKGFAMRFMFDSSASSSWSHVKTSLKKYGIENSFSKFDKKYDEKSYVHNDGSKTTYSKRLFELMFNQVQSVVLNEHKDTSVFVDESCIMFDVCQHLRKHGYTVYCVFDGIYFGKAGVEYPKEQAEAMVENLVKYYAFTYMNKYYWNNKYNVKFVKSDDLSVSGEIVLEEKAGNYDGFEDCCDFDNLDFSPTSVLPYSKLDYVNVVIEE